MVRCTWDRTAFQAAEQTAHSTAVSAGGRVFTSLEWRSGGPAGMTTESMTLEVRNRQQWRTWLRKHHASSPGVWLLFYKDHTGVKSIPYEDSVREALCFGWIDSLIKRLDDDRYARKFTPRQPSSKWSAISRKRWWNSRRPACSPRLASRRRQRTTLTPRCRQFRICRPTSPTR